MSGMARSVSCTALPRHEDADAQPRPLVGARTAKLFDKDNNPTDLGTFFRHNPSFVVGPLAVATLVCAISKFSTVIAGRITSGQAAPYGAYNAAVYTICAITATFAAHGWFVLHAAQERQFQSYERVTRDENGRRLPPPAEGQGYIDYKSRDPPKGASVRSTATLLTSWVYAFYPFGAPTTSWGAFMCWTCGLAVYWDCHFFVAHKIFHENPKLYKFFHKLHHFYTAPDVFGAYYVTYQSHFVTEQLVLLLAVIAGLPRDVFAWTMFLGTIDTCIKHSGHDVGSVKRGLFVSYESIMTALNPWSLVLGGASSGEHDWHHEKFTTNYALSFTYLDRIFGSYNPGRKKGEAVGLSDSSKRKWAEAEAARIAAAADISIPKIEAVPATSEAIDGMLGVPPPSPPPSPSPSSVGQTQTHTTAGAPVARTPKRGASGGNIAFLVLPLLAAYCAIVAAQTKGPELVGFLHGAAAQAEASKPPEDVAPGTPLLELCEGYAAHHFDSIGNSLHAAGMTAGLISLYVGLSATRLTRAERVASILWHPPLWYLWAWVGHFGLQKDVPAVFTYGLTPKSFLSGELCSTMWVYSGKVFASKPSALWPADGNVPPAVLLALAAAVLGLIGTVSPPGKLWQKEFRARAAAKAKSH